MNMYIEYEQAIRELVREALAENEREGSKFDADGFANFFRGEDPDKVRDAWWLYDQVVNRGVKF